MAKIYKHLTTQERAVVMIMRADECSTRSIVKRLCRSPSTISREFKPTSGSGVYDADLAHTSATLVVFWRDVCQNRMPMGRCFRWSAIS